MIRKSNKVRDSRYVQGGIVDVFSKRLGWWERSIIGKSNTDVAITITPKYNRRPELLAFDMYGKANLMWLVLQFNNIVDINEEFLSGKKISLPSKARVVREILTASPTFK